MAKLTKTTLFKDSKPRAETLMDKVTRVAREIIDDETEERQRKTDRLRKARLEREAGTPEEAPPAKTKTRKKPARVRAGGKS